MFSVSLCFSFLVCAYVFCAYVPLSATMPVSGACPACSEALPTDGRLLKCIECEYAYHLGNCSGWSESTFKSKGETGRSTWRCTNCRNMKPKGAGRQGMEPELAASLADIARRLDALAGLPGQVEQIKASIQLMSDKYDEILNKQVQQDREIGSLRQRVETLEKKPCCDNAQVKELESSLNNLEMHSRKHNIEVHGVPRTPNENLLLKLNGIAKSANLPELSVNDVDAVHRLPAKPGKEPGIVVRFVRQSQRDAWLDARKVLKNVKSTVTIVENMTKQQRDLLRSTRTWAAENDYRFTWHSNGKVLVRKAEGARAVVIRSKDDLLELAA